MASLARTVPSLARTVPSLARTVLKPSVLPQRGTRRQRQLVVRMDGGGGGGWWMDGWDGTREAHLDVKKTTLSKISPKLLEIFS